MEEVESDKEGEGSMKAFVLLVAWSIILGVILILGGYNVPLFIRVVCLILAGMAAILAWEARWL